MLKTFKELYYFSSFSKVKLVFLILLSIVEAFFVISSIALLYPLINFLLNQGTNTEDFFSGNMKYLKYFYDTFDLNVNLLSLVLIALIPVIFQAIVNYIKTVEILRLQQDAMYNIRSKLISKLLYYNVSFFLSTTTGKTANILVGEAGRSGTVLQYIFNYYSGLFIFAIYFIVLLSISINLTFISLCFVIFVVFLNKKNSTTLQNLSSEISSISSRMQTFLVEKMQMIKKIKLLNTMDKEKKTYLSIAKEYEKTYLSSGKIQALVNSSLEVIVMLMLITIIFTGVSFLNFNFDLIVLYLIVLVKFSAVAKTVIQNKNQVSSYVGSFNSVKSLYEKSFKYEEKQSGFLNKLEHIDEITYDKLTLQYNKNTILDNLSLSIAKNTTVALVGKSGAGKSTFIDLFVGLIKPTKGDILINKKSLYSYDICSFRSKIGYITQQPYLFKASLKENLLYGIMEDKSEDEIKKACKQVDIWEFICTLNNGLDTIISESGNSLSGGQKQRLQLAHLLLQNPDIIILDEPTSAVDKTTEKLIFEMIQSFKHNKTIIIVTHDLSNISFVDRLIVLNEGKVVEDGSFDELLKQNGYFYLLYNKKIK